MNKILNGEILKAQAKCREKAAENDYNAAKHLMEKNDISVKTLMGFLKSSQAHLQKSIEYTNRLITEFSDVLNTEDLQKELLEIKKTLGEVENIIATVEIPK